MPASLINSLSSQEILNLFPTIDPGKLPNQFQYTGNKSLLFKDNPRIAIVGSRNITSYGQQILDQIIPEICSHNFTIISGGAFGVDIQSQSKALNFTSNLITILGSGLSNLAPKTNIPIFQKILQQGGTICSPFQQDQHPTKYTFVQRNQFIAGLADIVLIIEAREKSGSLYTAQYAAEQGIPTACFPGNVNQPLSKGTNDLIKQGAHLVTCLDDILALLPSHKKTIQHQKQNRFDQTLMAIQQIAFS